MSQTNTIRLCEEKGCYRRHHARGVCMRHYSKTDFKKASNKAYRKRNPEKLGVWKREQARRHRKRYPELWKARAQTRRANKIEGLKRFGWIDVKLVSNYYTRTCGICGLKIESNYELDHVIPLARNGTHILDNLQLAHPVCNRTKRARLQKEMGLDIMILKELIND